MRLITAIKAAATQARGPKPGAKRILQARNIEKFVGSPGNEFQVLKGVDVELYCGELTLLMGPSGSGKTTLLSILGCILTPTSGQLQVSNETATGLGAEGLADLRRRKGPKPRR